MSSAWAGPRTPVDGYWRPVDWPVSNHVIRRPLRIWSLNGPDEAALAALSRRKAEPLRLPAPSLEEERAQLATELAAVREFDTPAPEFDTPARESDIRRCRTRARCRGEATQIIRRALGQD